MKNSRATQVDEGKRSISQLDRLAFTVPLPGDGVGFCLGAGSRMKNSRATQFEEGEGAVALRRILPNH